MEPYTDLSTFARFIDERPVATAVTYGPEHRVAYANRAFSELLQAGTRYADRPLVDALSPRTTMKLATELDRVRQGCAPSGALTIASPDEALPSWHCSVWRERTDGHSSAHLIVEIRNSGQSERALAFQRDVAERMLLASLRSQDAMAKAEDAGRRASFLAAAGRRLAESLDEESVRDALARLTLASLSAWCFIDVFDGDGRMRRLPIAHPDAATQEVLRQLEDRWSPMVDDPFGLPQVIRQRIPTIIPTEAIEEALVAGAHDAATLRVLRQMSIGSMLTVPFIVRGTLVGAATFVTRKGDREFSDDDVGLAEDLAIRAAVALESARVHREAIEERRKAESANAAKSTFLGTMSHELRTPLNAIGGYVDLLLLGIRGPMNAEQEIDLRRIRRNQSHLLALITDLLNFVRIGNGSVKYDLRDVVVNDVIESSLTLVDPLITQKGISCDVLKCSPGVVARADSEKVQQILVNLFSNAIKFTPSGGEIEVGCGRTDSMIQVSVADTGIGIPPEKLEAIFDPFVQVKEGLAGRESGVGLGLSISRDLARGMGGDLLVESQLRQGSKFTLRLPQAEGRAGP
jgi:signal transduction histidine kinase